MTAYSVFMAGMSLALHRHEDVPNRAAGDWDTDLFEAWRHRAAVTLAIGLWLLTWLGGWWVGRFLSSGSFVWTLVGAVFGWCIGLGIATLILYLDERF